MTGYQVLFVVFMVFVAVILAIAAVIVWDELTPRRPRPLDDKPEHDMADEIARRVACGNWSEPPDQYPGWVTADDLDRLADERERRRR